MFDNFVFAIDKEGEFVYDFNNLITVIAVQFDLRKVIELLDRMPESVPPLFRFWVTFLKQFTVRKNAFR